jgi:hypothetical protein
MPGEQVFVHAEVFAVAGGENDLLSVRSVFMIPHYLVALFDR